MTELEKPDILIVDFGSQTTHLIGRRLRDLGVTTEYIDPQNALQAVELKRPKGLILSGGPASVYEEGAPTIDPQVLNLGIPTLGICYGFQHMVQLLGGEVVRTKSEYGPEQLQVKIFNELFFDLFDRFKVWLSHGDTVTGLPPGFRCLASTDRVENAAASNFPGELYGIQFHPEHQHTEYGKEILTNFARSICGIPLNPIKLDPESMVEKIRGQVGDKKVVCAVSGGVDSTVAACLIGQAIGEGLIPVYVDSGLMRMGTEEHVRYIFSQLIGSSLTIITARERFLATLSHLKDPERKRKAVGRLYMRILEEEAEKYPDVEFLAQGTIYSDVIESAGSRHASTIKSHHNVGGLPGKLKLKLLEPLRELFKDEVRQIGRSLGLPDEVVNEQPFPGPGYAVRIRGKVTEKRLNQVILADQIVIEELKRAGLYDQVFQSFAVMTGAHSTAVKGDAGVFEEVVAVRIIESEDVMTGDWVDLPKDVLQKISGRIVSEVPNVSRVMYDITPKPPATMEWE